MKLLLVLLVVSCLLTAQTDNKQLSLYGCADLGNKFSWNQSQVCKIYDPETHRRFMVAWVIGDKGDGVALLEIDHSEAKR